MTMSIDPAVQLAIVAGINALLMYWLQHTLAKKSDDNHADTKVRISVLDEKVDGKLAKLLDTKDDQAKLSVELAESKAMALGQERGEAKATLASLQHSQRVSALHEEQAANGKKVEADKQVDQTDRIEKTGDETLGRVKRVETNTDKRVADVEEKIDKKEDKA